MKPRTRNSKLGDIIRSITRRDPSKRQIKPVNTETLLLDDLDDESDAEYVYDGNSDVSEDSESSSENGNGSSSSDSKSEGDGSDSSIKIIGVSRAPIISKDGSTLEDAIAVPSEAYPLNLHQNDMVLDSSGPHAPSDFSSGRICMFCLKKQSSQNDEVIECDACKIIVHEDCHKVYDEVFPSSSASSSDTDPWFCEPCLAGVENPHCELCPNLGGVFKRTDNNRWVHLLCALYIHGVAFNYTDSLTEVTLTELSAKEWSSKECSLCEEKFFAWTGVCINCDAGLCKSYFHVTCAQREGLLAEPAYEENPGDPFFAHCRQHTDKDVAKDRRRKYLLAYNRCHRLRQMAEMEKKDAYSIDALEDFATANNDPRSKFAFLDCRLREKLEYFRRLYDVMLSKREVPYTRPNKAPLFLENSPVAMRLFMAKAVALSLPIELTGSSAVTEASKSLAPGCPVFCPDFITYVLEREKKIEEYSKKLRSLESMRSDLQSSDANISRNYNSLSTRLAELNEKLAANRSRASSLLQCLSNILPGIKASGDLAALLTPPEVVEVNSTSVTADSSGVTSVGGGGDGDGDGGRAGVGDGGAGGGGGGSNGERVVTNARGRAVCGPARQSRKRCCKESTSASKRVKRETKESDVVLVSEACAYPVVEENGARLEPIFQQCSVCNGYRDQHLLTTCETCKKAFHIGCLDPPLTRVPKRSKLFAWQCSMCTLAVVPSGDTVTVDVNAPRQLRRATAPPALPPPPSLNSSITPTSTVTIAPKPVKIVSHAPVAPPSTHSKRSSTSMRGRGKNRRVRPGRPRRVEAEAYPCQVETQKVVPAESYPTTVICSSTPLVETGSDGVEMLSVSQQLRKVGYGEEGDGDDAEEDEDSYSDCGGSSASDSEESETPDNEDKKVSVPASAYEDLMTKRNASDDELASLRGSKVKFVRIKDHESPNESLTDSAPQRYVICQPQEAMPKKSPTSSNFKIKIRKSTDS